MTEDRPVEGHRVRDFRDLVAWQTALRLAVVTRQVVRSLPLEEQRELGRQLRTATLSVVSNIAEGNGRFSKADYLRHLSMASGSLNEVQAQLLLARACGFVSEHQTRDAMQLATQTGRLLMALVRSLRKSEHR